MGIGDVEPGSAEYLDANVPDLPVSTDGQAEYFVETDDPALLEDGRIFAPMDALHEAPSLRLAHRICSRKQSPHRRTNGLTIVSTRKHRLKLDLSFLFPWRARFHPRRWAISHTGRR